MRKLVFLCVSCGKTATVRIERAPALSGLARCYFPPAGWAMLYPPPAYPTRSGICASCVRKAGKGVITPDGKGVSVPDCPLKLEVCYPSCHWWKDGKCAFRQKRGG